jgi:hypothetical protein
MNLLCPLFEHSFYYNMEIAAHWKIAKYQILQNLEQYTDPENVIIPIENKTSLLLNIMD